MSFAATGWLALALVLLCALAPLGLPSSRQTGSAFNPATTAVLLKARSPAAPRVEHADDGDGGARAMTSLDRPRVPFPAVSFPTILSLACLAGIWRLVAGRGCGPWRALTLMPLRLRPSLPVRAPPRLS